ncbi:MAG: SagB/ThcOx family dehydrogenase [Syntrophobacteraceae bacterium]
MSVERVTIKLPQPVYDGKMSIESALLARRSIRSFKDEPLTVSDVSQLLWAAQGVTRRGGYRTCPSAGALYPLELQLVAGNVDGLSPGIYNYRPDKHELVQNGNEDLRRRLAEAALGQSVIAHAPVTIAICAVYERIRRKYGERGIRYVFMEAGHAAQNVHLQAVPLNLGTVVIGAFHDDKVKEALGLAAHEDPLYLMPVGR